MIERYVIVRLKTATRCVRAGGRTLRHESPFGNLHCLPLREALHLVESGDAKLLSQFRERIVREMAAAEA